MFNPNGASNAVAYFGTEAADTAAGAAAMGGIEMQLMSASAMERRF